MSLLTSGFKYVVKRMMRSYSQCWESYVANLHNFIYYHKDSKRLLFLSNKCAYR